MGESKRERRWLNSLALMVLVALALRLVLIVWLQYYDFGRNDDLGPFAPHHFHFAFGYETGAIAYSLATGHGFSSPFGGSTGPTSWVAPLYPAMSALVFKVFGCFTLASGFVILLLNSLFSALTCIPICGIGELTLGRKVGIWSGWIWAAGVIFMRWPTTWVWDMSASALLMAILFLQSLELAEESTARRWVVFGAVWGIAALTNPALLAFLPASGLYPVFKLARNHERWFRHALVASLVFGAVISPWLIRNRMVFGTWIFIRGNAPFEFWLGNYHGSNGMGWGGKHPAANGLEYADYKRMGEVSYVASKGKEAAEFVRQYPGEFAALCATRAAAFWKATPLELGSGETWRLWFYWALSALMLGGLMVAVAAQVDGAWLYCWLMLLYPMVYYLAFAQMRNRHAIEPEMLLLSTYFVHWALEAVNRRCLVRRRSQVELRPALIETK